MSSSHSRFEDTIVAPATAAGAGAISVIRVSGPESFRVVDAILKLKRGTISNSAAYTVHFGTVYKIDNSVLDDVLATVFHAPHSYTGEDSVEISCHGSSYIIQEIISLLISTGARLAEPGEYTRRAFLNGKMDLAQAEAVADVIYSDTSASHRVAMNQLRGGYSNELNSLREELLNMASLLELELDFSEEEVEFAKRDQLLDLLDRTASHVHKLASSFREGNAIKNGIPVAIAGAVNAGKSTLLNALVGEDRAIVSDTEGTTRDTIEEAVNLDGILFRFIDTAGIRETSEEVEKLGIDRTFRKISQAQIVLAVVDSKAFSAAVKDSIFEVYKHFEAADTEFIIILNKCDLVDEDTLNKIVKSVNEFVLSLDIKADIIKLSAKNNFGIEDLVSRLKSSKSVLLSQNSNATLVTNLRHYEELSNAFTALTSARMALISGVPSDLVAEDIRLAISHINLILGTSLTSSPIDAETVLHTIFSRHCIGK